MTKTQFYRKVLCGSLICFCRKCVNWCMYKQH